jgi:hypothetical protein
MVNTYGEEIEKSIREDNTTTKILDYDLIVDVQKWYDESQVRMGILNQNIRK